MPTQTTVTDLYKQNELQFVYGKYNILDCGIRTGKTYWALHNLQSYTRDGKSNRILFLVNQNMLKEQLLLDYSDHCVDADTMWETSPAAWGEQTNKIGVMCYQRFGAKILKGQTDFLSNIDVICWDECDSIFDFATDAFRKARRSDFARTDMNNAEVLAAIQQYSTKKEYMPLILLGFWEELVQKGNILCIGLSGSPMRAQQYYTSLVSASYSGKLDAGYRLAETIYFTNILDHISHLTPEVGQGYWCYSPRIEINKAIVQRAKQQGFRAIEIHSKNNTDKPMDEEQLRVYDCIETTHMVPYEYDFVVINATGKTGITIEDTRFTRIIINALREDERIQAPRQVFPYQVHQKTWMAALPAEYLNTWLPMDKCRELAASMQVSELRDGANKARSLTWNSLKALLPTFGYKVESARKRLDGKQQTCYYISGEWHDVVPADNLFLQLAAAHNK